MGNEQNHKIANERDFDAFINDHDRVIALIYSSWCPFCNRFLPVFKKLAEGRKDFLLAEDNKEVLADRYGVDVVPTALYFANGELTKRLDGRLGVGLTETQLHEFVKECGY